MGLPYTYKSLYYTDTDLRTLFNKIKQSSRQDKVSDLNLFYNSINFFYNTFFFLGKESVEITSDERGLFFEVKLEKLLRVAILTIVILAFFVKSIWSLIILSGLLILIMYVLVIVDVHNSIVSLLDDLIKGENIPEKLSPEQIQWLKDPDRCPACGEHLSPYDSFCPECGLNLKGRRKPKIQPVSRTGFFYYRIYYKYKKNSDNRPKTN